MPKSRKDKTKVVKSKGKKDKKNKASKNKTNVKSKSKNKKSSKKGKDKNKSSKKGNKKKGNKKKNKKGNKKKGDIDDSEIEMGDKIDGNENELNENTEPKPIMDPWDELEQLIPNINTNQEEEFAEKIYDAYDIDSTQTNNDMKGFIDYLLGDPEKDPSGTFGQNEKLFNLLCKTNEEEPYMLNDDKLLEDYTGCDDPLYSNNFGILNPNDYELKEVELDRLFKTFHTEYLQPLFGAYIHDTLQWKPQPPAPVVFEKSVSPKLDESQNIEEKQIELKTNGHMDEVENKFAHLEEEKDDIKENMLGVDDENNRLPLKKAKSKLIMKTAEEEEKEEELLEQQLEEKEELVLDSQKSKQELYEEAQERLHRAESEPNKDEIKEANDLEEPSVIDNLKPPDEELDDLTEDDRKSPSATPVPISGEEYEEHFEDEEEEDDLEGDSDFDSDKDEKLEEPILDIEQCRTLRKHFATDYSENDTVLFRPVGWHRLFYHRNDLDMELPNDPRKDVIKKYDEDEIDSIVSRDHINPKLSMNTILDKRQTGRNKFDDRLIKTRDLKIRDEWTECDLNLRDTPMLTYCYDFTNLHKLFWTPCNVPNTNMLGDWYTYRFRMWGDGDDTSWYGSDDPSDKVLLLDLVITQNAHILSSKPATRVCVFTFPDMITPEQELFESVDLDDINVEDIKSLLITSNGNHLQGICKIGPYIIGSNENKDWYSNKVISLDAYVPAIFNLSIMNISNDLGQDDDNDPDSEELFINKANRSGEPGAFNNLAVNCVYTWTGKLEENNRIHYDDNSDEPEELLNAITKKIILFDQDCYHDYYQMTKYYNKFDDLKKLHFPKLGPWFYAQSFFFNNLNKSLLKKPIELGIPYLGYIITYSDSDLRINKQKNRSKREDSWTLAFGFTAPLPTLGSSTLIYKHESIEIKIKNDYTHDEKDNKYFFRSQKLEVILKYNKHYECKIYSKELSRAPFDNVKGMDEDFYAHDNIIIKYSNKDITNSHIIILSKCGITGKVDLYLDGKKQDINKPKKKHGTGVLEDRHLWRIGHKLTGGDQGSIEYCFHGFMYDIQLIPLYLEGYELNLLHRLYNFRRHRHIQHLSIWNALKDCGNNPF